MKYFKIVVVASFLFFSTYNLLAQNDTLWYNANWIEVPTKAEASFFRPPVKQIGELFKVEDYYISGALQMSGTSKYAAKDFWEGTVTWYAKDGKVYQKGTYKNNRLEGTYISYIEGKKITSTYKNGIYVSGDTNTNCGTYYIYLEETKDGFKRVYHAGDLKGIRYEEYLDKSMQRVNTKYYDGKGDYLGESKINTNGSSAGVYVYYNFKPFALSSIQYTTKNGTNLGQTVYDKNGNLREEFLQEPNYKTIYYTNNGKQLGELTYSLDNSYLRPEDGTRYIFVTKYDQDKKEYEPTYISTITSYKEGKVVKSVEKYPNQKDKVIYLYKDGYKVLDQFFDENGNKKSELTYKDYRPYNGIQYGLDLEREYVEGVMVKSLKYYPNTKKVFMLLKGNLETYYDEQGKVIGTLELSAGAYSKPENGVKYTTYKKERKEVHKDGKLSEVTILRKAYNTDDYFKIVETYDAIGYTKTKELKYYSNGALQSDITYKDYNKTFGVFYDEDGEELGAYDYTTKEGKRYEFYPESNQIREFEEIKDGETIRSLVYENVYNKDTKVYDYVLVQDINAKKNAVWYDKKGKELAKATFKDGKIFEGTIYDRLDRKRYQIKEGKKNGVYEKYDYNGVIIEKGMYVNDLREGEFATFNNLEAKMSSINYEKDKLEGEAIYYDGAGKVLSKMIYKAGKPYEGKITDYQTYNKSYKESTYKNGAIVQAVDANNKGKKITNYKDDKHTEVISYNKNGIKILAYNLNNNVLEGEVIAYDEKGKITRKAVFENGKLVSGIVKLKDLYNQADSYYLLTRTATAFTLEKYNGEYLELKATEQIELGIRLKYINKLYSQVDYIYVSDIR
jgi:antitoxin component YwqK of YwqJK toxin-antitoxin module